mmetsp:Transcript_9671/g.32794  ORF Transcript_9671/g.32794 Transcript_9671/m.32794 type:complete len:311 (+) Transcript_9671:568-1500(+)
MQRHGRRRAHVSDRKPSTSRLPNAGATCAIASCAPRLCPARPMATASEDHILVLTARRLQHVLLVRRLFVRRVLRVLLLLCGLRDVLLLLVLRALQTEEFLALELVELRVDVGHGVGEAGHDHAVERVHAAVGHLDRLVECDEGRLEGRQLDEHVHGLGEGLAGLGYRLPALGHADKLRARVRALAAGREDGHLDACHVVHMELHRGRRLGHVLDDRGLDVARGELDLGECEHAFLEGQAHGVLARHDLAQQAAHAHGERVSLLLEQAVALLGGHQLGLHHAKVLAGGEHIEPRSSGRHAAARASAIRTT